MAEALKVAKVSEIPAGAVRTFTVGGRSLAVANVGGNFYAIDNLCTHDGGPLGEGTLADSQVECPRHGARFDLTTGRPTTLPAVLPVRTYAVAVDGEDVTVRLD
jgi:3-phenylpropionate/trans-cinnamate dioxygenase ferredoxin component